MTMRVPDTAMIGHLKWTDSGVVWATWRLEGLPKGLGGSELNETRRRIHRALAHGIIGEYMLMGLGGMVSPDEVANNMLDGVDVSEHPMLAEEVLLAMDDFDAHPHGRREFWISVPLKAKTPVDQLRRVWSWLENSARERVALRVAPPAPDAVVAALRAAKQIEDAIPGALLPRRATVAEQVWIATHAVSRGLYESSAPQRRPDEVAHGARQLQLDEHLEKVSTPKSYPPFHMDEGGQTDTTSKIAHRNPLKARFLKVTNLRAMESSYQCMLALSGTPKGGWDEDLDWVGTLDELGVNADWVFRVQSISAREAKRRNSRIEANIADQMDQQEGTAAITGTGGEMDVAASDLNQFHQELGAYDREVQVQATFIVAVGDSTADGAIARAEFVRKYFADSLEFQFDIPVGGQEALWWAMWPGSPTTRIVREFAELTTGTHFATLTPLTSTELGDNKGVLIADNISNGMERPVLLDLWGQIKGDVSGSIGLAGEQGGGKTVFIKIVIGGVHDRGGRFVAIDGSKVREYATFAKTLDQTSTILVDLVNPKYSLDPLRIFGAEEGASHMYTLCASLLGIEPLSEDGIMLATVLSERRAKESNLVSIGHLHQQLKSMGAAGDSTAKRLAGLMDLYSDTEYGAVLFDDTLPVLDLDARAIVFLTYGVALPTKEELESPHQFKRLGLDKIFGNAMYALLARLSKEICFRNRNELALWVVDEFKHVAANPHSLAEAEVFLRQGRKHGAPLLIASQDARDFGGPEMRALIKNRVLTRQTDTDAAESNLEWFQKGFSKDEVNVKLITEQLSPLGPDNKVPVNRRGEALFRDARGRMGKIRTRVSRRPERAQATLSTPDAEKAPAPEEVSA